MNFNDNSPSVFQQFFKYVSFNILGMLGLSCYILADTFFISKGMGADGLTALNLAIPVYSFIHGSGLMIGIGGATRYSLLKNGSSRQAMDLVFSRSVLYALGFSCMFVFAGIFFPNQLSRLLGADANVHQMTSSYLQVILVFAPAFMMNNVLLAFIRNDGNPRLSMLAMITGSLSNIVLDYLFIFPMGMGIFGAALATGFAPLISIAILSTDILGKRVQFHLKKVVPSLSSALDIGSLGASALITELSSGIVMIVFNFIILGLQGNVGVAAYGVIANIALVILSIFTGIAQGSQPIISGYFGRGQHTDAKKVYRYGLITAVLFSVLIYLLSVLYAQPIVGIFNKDKDPFLQAIAVQGIRLYFIGFLFAGINVITSAFLSAADRPKPAFLISSSRGFVLIIPVAWLMSALLSMNGVWLSFPVTELLTCFLSFWAVKIKSSQP